MPKNVKQKLKRNATRARRGLVKRLSALKRDEEVGLAELEAVLQIATDLDARDHPEGPLGRMVRDLFDAHLDRVRLGTIGLELHDLVIMGRLAQRFVLRGQLRQDAPPRV